MRIVAGIYRGRHFDIPRTFKARPTTDFAKENLFNVLQGYIDLDGKTALDLFSGTGSISYELLSRGCSRVVSVEADRDHQAFIRQCTAKLQADDTIRLVRADVFRYLSKCKEKFDIIFADPPYALHGIDTLPDIILGNGLLNDGGIFILEHGKNQDFSTHQRCVDHRRYGSVNFTLFR